MLLTSLPQGDPALVGKNVVQRLSPTAPPGQASSPSQSLAIDVREASSLSYDEFVSRYMAANRPVLIRGLTDDWPAVRRWVADSRVDVDAMEAMAGDSKVLVTETDRCGVCIFTYQITSSPDPVS